MHPINFKFLNYRSLLVALFVLVILLAGTINFVNSCKIIKKQTKDELIIRSYSYAEDFDNYFNLLKVYLDHYTYFVKKTIDLDKFKKTVARNDIQKFNAGNIPYISNYLKNTVKPLTLDIIKEASLFTGIYFYFDPEQVINKEAIGIWYADDVGNGRYKALPNGYRSDFYPVDAVYLKWYYEPKNTRKDCWVGPYIDKDIKEDMISYVKPVIVDSHFIGVTGADVNISRIKDFIYKFNSYNNSYAHLLDKNYKVIYSKKYPGDTILKYVDLDLYETLKIKMTKKIKIFEHKFDNTDNFYTFNQLKNGFIILIEVPKKELYKPLNDLALCLMIITILLICITIWAVIKIDKFIRSTQAYILHNEKLASIGVLSAGVAHEINTPLGYVSCNIDTLEKYVNNIKVFSENYDGFIEENKQDFLTKYPKIREIMALKDKLKIKYINENLDSLIVETKEGLDVISTIVKNLKMFSKDDSRDEKTEENLNEIIESSLNILRNKLKKNILLKKDFKEIPNLMCSKNQINQVLMNIILNAIQAIQAKNSEETGKITISTYNDNKYVYCKIQDNGIGIKNSIKNRIFDSFFTTKSVNEGTGLGLSISHNIITQKHNGRIEFESKENEGTTFVVRLPYKQKKEIVDES